MGWCDKTCRGFLWSRASADAAARHAPEVGALARAEGLDAHARAVELRASGGSRG